jgi:hypothetical protein
MRIYVASSWRNEIRQQETVKVLREEGHEVYDFRHPLIQTRYGFSWHSVSSDPEELKDPKRFRDEILPRPLCQQGFNLDMNALRASEVTVLVLPCGRSAHLELGWAIGAGQYTLVLLDNPLSEPELMYLACTDLCINMSEIIQKIRGYAEREEKVGRGIT